MIGKRMNSIRNSLFESIRLVIVRLMVVACLVSHCIMVGCGGNSKIANGNVSFTTRPIRLFIADSQEAGKAMYHAQLVPLVSLDSGEVISPVVYVERPKKSGAMGGIEYVKERQPPLLGVRGANGERVGLPIGPEIVKYIFLVQALTEPTGWRYFEFSSSELPKDGARVAIPPLRDLQRLDDREDGKELWAIYERAKSEKWHDSD